MTDVAEMMAVTVMVMCVDSREDQTRNELATPSVAYLYNPSFTAILSSLFPAMGQWSATKRTEFAL